MSSSALKRLVPAAKVVLAVVLLAWLFSGAHWHDYTVTDEGGRQVVRMGLASSLRQTHLSWMACAVALSAVSVAAAALRWRMLLAAQGVYLPVKEALKMTLLGDFFSTVMPGTVGGDAVKAYFVMKGAARKSGVLISTIADRLIGLCAMTGLALAMLVVTWTLGLIRHQAANAAAVSIAVAVAAILAAMAVLLSARLRRALGLRRLLGRPSIQRYVAGAGQAVAALRRQPRALLGAAAISLISQSLQICAAMVIGLGLMLPLEWYGYFLYVPIIFIVAAVPLTPGGLGVAEQLYVAYLGWAGNPSGVLALALLMRLALTVSVLPGAVVLLLGPKLPPAEAIHAELDAAETQAP